MEDKIRRRTGLLLGCLMGLVFGLVSLTINPLLLPGVPLYEPPPGRVAGVILRVILGGLTGLATAWTEEAAGGIIFGALTATLLSSLMNLQRSTLAGTSPSGMVVLLFVTFLPRAVLALPLAGGMRWVVQAWGQRTVEKGQVTIDRKWVPGFSASRRRSQLLQKWQLAIARRKKALSITLLIAISAAAGLLSIHTPNALKALRLTNDLVLAGREAHSAKELPVVLQSVEDILEHSQEPYSLLLSDNPDLLPIARRSVLAGEEEVTVLVLFEQDFRFACIWRLPAGEAVCGRY